MGRIEWEMHSKLLLKELQVKNQSVVVREWLARVCNINEKTLRRKNRAQMLYFDK